MRIIRECDLCGKEDSIECVSGLCPSCEELNEKQREYFWRDAK